MNNNPEDRAAWLNHEEALRLLEEKRAGRSLRDFAAYLGGITFQNLGAMLQGKRAISPAVLQLLGYRAVTLYAPIEDPRKNGSKR